MKSFVVVLAVLGITNAQHWNNPNWAVGPPAPVQDTPEVAAAKAAHYAALARAQPQGQPQQAQWGQQQNQWNAPQQSQARWQGPLALPPGFDQNGAPLPVHDTAEVAAERTKHFNLVGGFGAPQNYGQQQWNAQPQQQQWAQPQQQQWAQPQQQQWAQPQQQQWNAQPQQQQWNAQPQQQQWSAQPQQQQWNAQPQQWAQPAQQGLPADTPEVAAAKAAHLAAHAQLHGRKRRSLIAPIVPITYSSHTAILPSARLIAAPTILASYW